MFKTDLLLEAYELAFQPLPPEPIWEWAESNVWLESKAAAESGFYRSSKTPWARRAQEIGRDPRMFVPDFANGGWTVVPVSEVNNKKSSQSGLSEACLNVVRWRARHRPCNVIYTIDTREEAKNIIARLLPTLEKIDGGDIFTGDDDDLGGLMLTLRAMVVWFFGSFSTGKFANKQAPLIVNDELEEHKRSTSDTSSDRSLASRRKTADEGLQYNISKPRRKGGPICKAFERGNQEEFHVQCPECGEWQWLTFFSEKRKVPFGKELRLVEIDGLSALLPDPLPPGEYREVKTGRVVFDHCKTPAGEWDLLAVMRGALHECGVCGARFDQQKKVEMVSGALWLPTAVGSPGVVSQHISDLYSTDSASHVGQIALDFLGANREGRLALQGFYNHRLGLEFREEVSKTEASDIEENIAGRETGGLPAYGRGVCPFVPQALILGSDVGGNYAKWSVGAVAENMEDCAIIDWGTEIDPDEIAEIFMSMTFPVMGTEKRVRLTHGFMDTKFRKRDCFKACLKVPGFKLIPCAGLGGEAARSIRLFSFNRIPTYPRKFCQLVYNDREAKNELYISCLKKKERRVWFPVGTEKDLDFVAELTAEELLEVDGETRWNPFPAPNHYGDTVKNIVTGLRFLTRKHTGSEPEPKEENS
jgi:hypothetical protein